MLSLVLAMSLAVRGQPYVKYPEPGIHVRMSRNNRMGAFNGGAVAALLRLLPDDGSGVGTLADLCDAYSAELVGNYFCLRGDGTQRSTAPYTLSAVGSPTASAARTCPNGLDCSSVSRVQVTGATNRYATAAVASPSGDFSICATVNPDSITTAHMIVAKSGTGGDSFRFMINGALGFNLYGSANQSANATTNLVAGNEYLACVTYDYVGNGTSVAKLYLNGVQNGPTTSDLSGPPPSIATAGITIGAQNGATFPLTGKYRNVFITEKVLSPTVIAQMYASTTATLTGSLGEAVTFTRAGTVSCTASDGSSYTVAANAPCIASSGLYTTAATVVRAANPIASGATSWCISAGDYHPTHRNPTAQQVLVQLGTYTAANSARLYFDENRNLHGSVITSTGAQRAVTASNWAAWTGPRTASMCVTGTGLPVLYGDGSPLDVTTDDAAGVGVSFTQPSFIYFSNTGGGSLPAIGKTANYCVSAAASACLSSPASRTGGGSKRVAFLGDSNTQGFGISRAFAEQVEILMANTAKLTWNYGIGGTVASQMLSRWRSYIQPRGFTHLVVMAGTNDIRADVTAATAWATTQTILDEARAAGLTVVPVTMPPFKGDLAWTSGRQTQAEAFNALVLAYCSSNGLTCVDGYDLLNDGVDTAALLAAYDKGDHLHLSQAGADALAAAIEAVVDP